MAKDDEGRQERGPQEGDDDPPVELPVRSPVDLRSLEDFVVDAAQTGEEHRHHEARGLPDRRDDDGVDRHVAVLDPVEGETLPSPLPHDALEPDAGVEEPFPRRSGDDERQRHGIEVDRPQHPLAPDLLVEEDREHQSDGGADDDVERGEDRDVDDRRVPCGKGEELLVVLESDPGESGQHLRAGEGQHDREEDEAVDEQERYCEGRGQHELRQPVLQPCAEIGLCRGHRVLHGSGRPRSPRGDQEGAATQGRSAEGRPEPPPLRHVTARRRRLRPTRRRRRPHRHIRH